MHKATLLVGGFLAAYVVSDRPERAFQLALEGANHNETLPEVSALDFDVTFENFAGEYVHGCGPYSLDALGEMV